MRVNQARNVVLAEVSMTSFTGTGVSSVTRFKELFSRPFVSITLVVGIVGLLLCCGFVGCSLGLISYPSTGTLAKRYLNAVQKGDTQAATGLAGSDNGCRGQMYLDAKRDIAQFGGAEIRNVNIRVRYGTGNDNQIQFAIVEFEYCKPGQSEWEQGEMSLLADSDVPGFRYLCGNLKYHGP